MKPRPPLPPPPYLVVGLARSGVAAALALRAAEPEARVVACDRGRPAEAADERRRLEQAGVEVHLDSDGTDLLEAADPAPTVVKSPGVPAGAPVVARARERGLLVVGELEIGWRLLHNEFCAVTGTNGKTTTAELIGSIYREAGLPVAVAGNVGTAVSAHAGSLEREATIVCEASSFQLEDALAFSPETAVFLNFSPDHLDRHGSAEAYLAAKLRVFANQIHGDVAVLNASEPLLRESEVEGGARRVWFGHGAGCELRLRDETLLWRDEPFAAVSDIRLRGPHNVENAMAASAAALAREVDAGAVRSALRRFEGAPHRLEEVARIGGVLYVNDSKATNVSAAAAALRAFDGGVHAILGGSLKGGDFAGLVPAVTERCSACYLVGEAAERLAHDLAASGVALVQCGDLERAVREAAAHARAEEVVLLAPACASFDQYGSFEERGEHFRVLVQALAGEHEGETRA